VIFVLVLANEGFVNLDDFDPATGNDSEEMGSEEKVRNMGMGTLPIANF
jgi:hypothetical protein